MWQKNVLLRLVKLLVGAYPSWPDNNLHDRQRIYFSNHTSHLDTVVILSAMMTRTGPLVRPVAARDYWDKGPIRRYIAQTLLRVVLIERKGASDSDPLAPLQQALSQGDSLIIFPEGTRGDEPLPVRFKSGLYSLALQFPDVELVPVYLENLNRVMPKGALLPVPLISKLYFGAPIALHVGEDRGQFLSRARDAVIALPGKLL